MVESSGGGDTVATRTSEELAVASAEASAVALVRMVRRTGAARALMEERDARLGGRDGGRRGAMVKADILPLTVKSVTVRLTRVSACACNDVGCARV